MQDLQCYSNHNLQYTCWHRTSTVVGIPQLQHLNCHKDLYCHRTSTAEGHLHCQELDFWRTSTSTVRQLSQQLQCSSTSSMAGPSLPQGLQCQSKCTVSGPQHLQASTVTGVLLSHDLHCYRIYIVIGPPCSHPSTAAEPPLSQDLHCPIIISTLSDLLYFGTSNIAGYHCLVKLSWCNESIQSWAQNTIYTIASRNSVIPSSLPWTIGAESRLWMSAHIWGWERVCLWVGKRQMWPMGKRHSGL